MPSPGCASNRRRTGTGSGNRNSPSPTRTSYARIPGSARSAWDSGGSGTASGRITARTIRLSRVEYRERDLAYGDIALHHDLMDVGPLLDLVRGAAYPVVWAPFGVEAPDHARPEPLPLGPLHVD